MKRWKTKNDKILVGSLLLLLAVISLPWVDRNELYNGFSILSSKDSAKSYLDSVQALDKLDKNDKENGVEDAYGANPFAGAGTQKAQIKEEKKEKEASKQAQSMTKHSTAKTISATKVESDKSKSEAVGCDAICQAAKAASGAPAQENIFAALAKEISDIAKSVTTLKEDRNRDSDPRKLRDRKDDFDDEDDDGGSDDLIEKACNKKDYKNKENNYYTLCAMKELARLAKLKDKNERPTSKEMNELLEEHVYDQLLEVMKEGMSDEASSDEKTAMRKADREIERLIEKLAGSRYKDTRKKLSEIKRLAINEHLKSTNKLLTEANALASAGDYVTASMLLREFEVNRNKTSLYIREELEDMYGVYSSMIGDDFSRSSANLEYRSFYHQPYESINTRLWSSNPAWDLGTQGNRSARAGGANSGFPRASGIRGGTQQPGFNNQGRVNSGPPVAGQRAQFGPGGSIGPAASGIQQQHSINFATGNGANWPNSVQGQQPGRFNAPYNNGSPNHWTNNVNPWATQPAGIHGAWNAPRMGSPGIASPGINGGFGGAYGGNNIYSGYPNYYNPGVARPPYAPGWVGGPGAPMQSGVYAPRF